MLGAAEADPLGAELARLRRVLGRVGVRADAQPAELVGPAEDRAEVLVDRGRHERHGADDHAARAAVDRQLVALAQLDVADPQRSRVHVDRERARSPATHGLPIPRATTAACEVMPPCAVRTPARVDQAVDVVGRRLPADEEDVLARPPALLGEIGVEHDRPGGGARATR